MQPNIRIRAVAPLFTLLAVSAHAQQVFSSNYSMPNGQGQEVGGTWNYYDGTYVGTGGNGLTALSPLSGGSGQLTNGQITNLPWDSVSNSAGTGAYVGWFTVNPVITFNFASTVTISTVKLNLDDSAVGSVYLPADVVINGKTYVPNQSLNGSSTPADISFSGVGFTGTSLTVELDRRPDLSIPNPYSNGYDWEMLNQAQFFATPEPASFLPVGLGVLLLARKRRSSR